MSYKLYLGNYSAPAATDQPQEPVLDTAHDETQSDFFGGALGFRIDPEPAQIAQQFIEFELWVDDSDEYPAFVANDQPVEVIVADVEQGFVADAVEEDEELAFNLPAQDVESDAELVLLDAVEHDDDEFFDFIAQDVEAPPAVSDEIAQQFIGDVEEEIELLYGGVLGFRIDAPSEEITQQFIDLWQDEEDEYPGFVVNEQPEAAAAPTDVEQGFVADAEEEFEEQQDFLENLLPEAMPALEEIEPQFIADAIDEVDERARGVLGFAIDDVEIVQQFIEQQVEEVEAFEDFLENLLPESGVAPEEIDQQFIDYRDEEDDAFDAFIDNLLPDLPPAEIEQQYLEDRAEEVDDSFDISLAGFNLLPETPLVAPARTLRYDLTTGMWVLVINDHIAMSL